jgi:hypothetical protein
LFVWGLGSGVCGLGFGEFAFLLVHAAVLESAIRGEFVGLSFGLYPFEVGEPGAVSELVEDAGGDEVRDVLDGIGSGGHGVALLLCESISSGFCHKEHRENR